eukprot:snap_masked-scaffold_67-processed-gene-0.46-mRNA-1 protein AED:1.00 eAED:1.00 QI:0/0/0/0/1/1/8/0/228
MMNSIKEEYEERYVKEYFNIEWECDDEETPINSNNFKREIEELIKGFQPDKEVSTIWFQYCPFDAVKSIFVRLILCFPAVKTLVFSKCRFSDENFPNFQKLKKVKLDYLEFEYCNIPEVSSFCNLLKSISVKDIALYKSNFSSIYISNIFKSLSFNKTIFKINIRQKVQNKVITSAIKNYFKTNRIIKSLIYGGSYGFENLPEEDIIELQEIVDTHPSILGLQERLKC